MGTQGRKSDDHLGMTKRAAQITDGDRLPPGGHKSWMGLKHSLIEMFETICRVHRAVPQAGCLLWGDAPALLSLRIEGMPHSQKISLDTLGCEVCLSQSILSW
eukprot:TRINITY_DN2528_c0_g1_i3.p1 TRINITY_DN2528_c0_g1~~TRINITY_DN2528_c0_g1_i3.p1  ORF type:complete len:103 (+),score=5.94 TRINITY_DN2528_c0_g1_i3:43-351(+)